MTTPTKGTWHRVIENLSKDLSLSQRRRNQLSSSSFVVFSHAFIVSCLCSLTLRNDVSWFAQIPSVARRHGRLRVPECSAMPDYRGACADPLTGAASLPAPHASLDPTQSDCFAVLFRCLSHNAPDGPLFPGEVAGAYFSSYGAMPVVPTPVSTTAVSAVSSVPSVPSKPVAPVSVSPAARLPFRLVAVGVATHKVVSLAKQVVTRSLTVTVSAPVLAIQPFNAADGIIRTTTPAASEAFHEQVCARDLGERFAGMLYASQRDERTANVKQPHVPSPPMPITVATFSLASPLPRLCTRRAASVLLYRYDEPCFFPSHRGWAIHSKHADNVVLRTFPPRPRFPISPLDFISHPSMGGYAPVKPT